MIQIVNKKHKFSNSKLSEDTLELVFHKSSKEYLAPTCRIGPGPWPQEHRSSSSEVQENNTVQWNCDTMHVNSINWCGCLQLWNCGAGSSTEMD